MSEYRHYWMLGKDVIGNTCIAHLKEPNDDTKDAHIHAIEYRAFEDVVNKYSALTDKYVALAERYHKTMDELAEYRRGS